MLLVPRSVLLLLAVIFTISTGGAIYGWASLSVLLEQEGEYAELCHPPAASGTTCAAQKVAYDRVFTVAVGLTLLFFFVNGLLLDNIGPRWLCTLGACVYALGCLLLAASRSGGPDLFIAAYTLLGWGGPAVWLSFMPLSELFPTASKTVLCVLNSAYDATPFTFTIFQFLHLWIGVSRPTLFLAYSALPVLIACSAPFLWCDSAEEYRLAVADTIGQRQTDQQLTPLTAPEEVGQDGTDGGDLQHHSKLPSPPSSTSSASPALDGPSLVEHFKSRLYSALSQGFSREYLWLAGIISLGILRINFYLGTLELQLRSLTPSDQVEWFLGAFGLIIVLGAVAAVRFMPCESKGGDHMPQVPLSGWLLDWLGRWPATWVLMATWAAFNLSNLLPSIHLQLLTFLLFAFFRPYFYSCVSSFMAESFGFGNFGTLYGLASVFGALISLLQWPVVAVTVHELNGAFFYPNVVLCLLQLPLFWYPISHHFITVS